MLHHWFSHYWYVFYSAPSGRQVRCWWEDPGRSDIATMRVCGYDQQWSELPIIFGPAEGIMVWVEWRWVSVDRWSLGMEGSLFWGGCFVCCPCRLVLKFGLFIERVGHRGLHLRVLFALLRRWLPGWFCCEAGLAWWQWRWRGYPKHRREYQLLCTYRAVAELAPTFLIVLSWI